MWDLAPMSASYDPPTLCIFTLFSMLNKLWLCTELEFPLEQQA